VKEEAVYVGDSIVDAKAATAAGVDFIGITSGIHAAVELQEQGAEQVIDTIEKLPDTIFSKPLSAV